MLLDEALLLPAFRYAFSLTICAYVNEFIGKFDNDGGSHTLGDLDHYDAFNSLRLVRNFVLRKVSEHYLRKDLKECNGNALAALSHNLHTLLLGPLEREFLVGHEIKTKTLLDSLDAKYPTELWLGRHREEELGEKLLLLLRSVLKAPPLEVAAENEKGAIGSIVADYMSWLMQNSRDLELPDNVHERLFQAMDVFITVSGGVASLQWTYAYERFVAVLQTHLAVLGQSQHQQKENVAVVLKLREQGNNLVSIMAYAQAIQVYTSALHAATVAAANQIPQLYTNRAIAYIGLNCFPEAITDLNKAVLEDRTFTPAWAQLGYCHLYMGTSLIALRCYLTAMRCVAGEIYPTKLPKDATVREEYKEHKLASVLPQFVQRLVQAIILTEKRAHQQRESTTAIRDIVGNARGILARLRARAANDDLSYFTYAYEQTDNSFRSMALRVNRLRPSILTEDVTQNVMAGTGVEAVTVPAASLGLFGTRSTPANTTLTPDTENASPVARAFTIVSDNDGNGPAAASNGVRNILNSFGDLFDGSLPETNPNFPNDPAPQAPAANTPNFNGEQPRERPSVGRSDTMGNIIRQFVPDFPQLFSQALNAAGNEHRTVPNRNQTPTHGSQTTARTSGNDRSHAAEPEEDTDMPDVPDLD